MRSGARTRLRGADLSTRALRDAIARDSTIVRGYGLSKTGATFQWRNLPFQNAGIGKRSAVMILRKILQYSRDKASTASSHNGNEDLEHFRGYAICTLPRSGSNWLSQVLTSTDALGRPLEYFNTEGRRQLTDPSYPVEPEQQIRQILTRGATGNGIYGVKIFPQQLTNIGRQVKWSRQLPALKLVRWTRKDILGQALSRHRALQTRQWRAEQAAQALPVYDGAKILASLTWVARQNARWDVFFARTAPPSLTLCYEDVVNDPQGVVDTFADLLGLETRPTIDRDAIAIQVQRDDTTAAWRERFQAEYADIDYIDDL